MGPHGCVFGTVQDDFDKHVFKLVDGYLNIVGLFSWRKRISFEKENDR